MPLVVVPPELVLLLLGALGHAVPLLQPRLADGVGQVGDGAIPEDAQRWQCDAQHLPASTRTSVMMMTTMTMITVMAMVAG